MKISQIYKQVGLFINDEIRKEYRAQGHFLSGDLERSINSSIYKRGVESILDGYALDYARTLEEGLDPSEISFKMFPDMVQYFLKRGLGPADAAKAAKFTILKWKKEGLSTQASKRFSQTGARQHAVESVFVGKQNTIDSYMLSSFDQGIDEQFYKTKSETI